MRIYGIRKLDDGKPITITYIPAELKRKHIYTGTAHVTSWDAIYFHYKDEALAFFEAYMCEDHSSNFGSEFILTAYKEDRTEVDAHRPAIYITRSQMPDIYISEEEYDEYAIEKTY